VACGEGLSCSLRAKIRESLNGKAFSGESSLCWLLRAFREVDSPTDFVAFGQARLPKKGPGSSSVVIKQVPGDVRHCCETLFYERSSHWISSRLLPVLLPEIGSNFFPSSSTIGSVPIGLQWRVPKS
jgi:hypothetical protein